MKCRVWRSHYVNKKIIVRAPFKTLCNLTCCNKIRGVSIAFWCSNLPNLPDYRISTLLTVSCLKICAHCLWTKWNIPVKSRRFERGMLTSDVEREITKQFLTLCTWNIDWILSQNSIDDCWNSNAWNSSDPRRHCPWQLAASNRNKIKTVSSSEKNSWGRNSLSAAASKFELTSNFFSAMLFTTLS